MASLGNLFFKIGADVSEATKGIKQVKTELESIKKITGFTAIVQGANAAIGVINSVVNAVRPLVEEFDRASKAAAKLQTALGGNVEEVQDLLQQANQLQRTRLFSSDQTVNAQAILASLGLTKTTIKELIPLIQDFASATGTDLNQAAQAVGKAVAVGGDGLKKYGVSIGEARTQSERYVSVVNGLTKAFGGQSEAIARVGAGPLQLMIQRFGQIKEIAGEALVRFANELLPLANNGIDQLATTMQNLPVYAENLGKAFNTAFGAIIGIYDTFVAIDNIAGKPLQKLQSIIKALFGIEEQQERVKNRSDLLQPGYAARQAGINRNQSPGGTGEPAASKANRDALEETATLMEILQKAQRDLMSTTAELDTTTEAYADAINDLKNIQQQLYDLEQKRLAVIKEISQQQFNVSKLPTKGVQEVKSIEQDVGVSAKLPGITDKTKEVVNLKNELTEVGQVIVGIGEAAGAAFNQLGEALVSGASGFKVIALAALDAARKIINAALAEAIAAAIVGSLKNAGNIIAGLALAAVAVGVVTALFRSKVPKLAKGGLAYGPQLAIVGDNPNASRDPEVISPLSKLRDMLTGEMFKMTAMMANAMDAALSRASVEVPAVQQNALEFSGPQEVFVKGKIEGNDIRLIYDRAASTNSKFQPGYY